MDGVVPSPGTPAKAGIDLATVPSAIPSGGFRFRRDDEELGRFSYIAGSCYCRAGSFPSSIPAPPCAFHEHGARMHFIN